MAGVGKRALLREVNPHLICPLCRGYFIDATTVVECLHSFCRSCILKHLNKTAYCPSCKHSLNKAKPNIKADKALQDIVYKLVPGLYHKEMRKRREFYKKHPEYADFATPEQRGEDVSGRLIFAPEDAVSLSLEYLPPRMDPLTILSTDMDTSHLNSSNVENTNNNTNNNNNNNNHNNGNRRYLQCPALVTIAHLKKFLALKYSVDMTRYTIEICHRRAPLPEHWTLMDVAYIYAWKRIAPMRFFYRVAQEEQRLEAPLHQRPSTPGLGACLPPNDPVIVNAKDDGNPDVSVDRSVTPRSEAKHANDEASTAKELSKVTNDKTSSLANNKQTTDTARNRASKTATTKTSASIVATADGPTKTTSSSELTVTSATTTLTTTASTVTNTTTTTTTTMSTTTTTTMSTTASMTTMVTTASTVTMLPPTTMMTKATMATTVPTATTATTVTTVTTMTTATTTTTCNDTNNKQMKSPIKIMKNSDGRYEVLRSPSTWNGKEQATAALPDVKPASPEFSVVSIGNGQNSNGVKITLKQCSPTSGTNSKKPKVISNVLLRCGQQLEKDSSSPLMNKQLQKDKEPSVSPPGQDKQQEKQRRKVTFVDRPMSDKISPGSGATGVPKTALKKPAEQQDKKQFLQGFQLTARESVPEDVTLKSPVRDPASASSENNSPQKKDNIMPKTEVSSKKDTTARGVIDEVREKSNIENTSSTASNVSTNTVARRVGEVSSANSARAHATRSSDDARMSPSSSTSSSTSANVNTNTNSGQSAAKVDVYSFHSSDSPVLAGAVKRKCPPGVPINDLKRRRQHTQSQNEVPRKPVSVPADILPLKRTSSSEHVIPTNRTSSVLTDYHSSPNRPVSNVNAKASTGSTLSSDTRNLLDGCGLNIPSSLSITLTSPKPPGSSLFPESTDGSDNRKPAALGKMNPTITLNDRSVDPRVLKALKTGQIKMPAPPKTKLTITKQTDQGEVHQQQQRITPPAKRSRREHESILDLSGSKKTDIHPLRIPQPVTKLATKPINKTTNNLPDDQGQVVTLMGGHRYYRAPPGSLTPAAHRVNEMPFPMPSRVPVYAPNLSDMNRPGPNLSSVFPSLQSLYVLSQSQFQMDGRLRLPSSPRSAAESIASAVIGGGDGGVNPSGLSSVPSKTHLAAQCAPVKPARSSVASLAVPINKQQQSIDKCAGITIRSVPNDANKSVKFQRNNEVPADDSCALPRLTAQARHSSSAENANKFCPRSNTDIAKSNEQTNVENFKNSTAEVERPQRNELMDNSKQHHDTASPRVSSTASPSPPPGNNGANLRNESAAVSPGGGNGSKASNLGAVSTGTGATSSKLPKSNADTTCCKSPASPDSSSVTVDSPTGKICASSTGRAPSTDSRTATDTTTKSSDLAANPDDSSVIADDKSSKTIDPPADAKQQLTTEMVQKRLLAVFPSNEWANNPEAAEHLGNFLKSLNATIKSDGHTEESKVDKIERKIPVMDDAAKVDSDLAVKPKKDVVEHS